MYRRALEMWLWQHENWFEFTWREDVFAEKLRALRCKQGVMLGKVASQTDNEADTTLDTLLKNILNSSAIEGETLNAFSVRSSLANKLGISESQPFPTTPQTDGLAEIMFDVIENTNTSLTLERVLHWHKLLFPFDPNSIFSKIEGGKIRETSPMQVVSGRIDKPIVHFEAPPHTDLRQELAHFFKWFNDSKNNPTLDPIIRAAISHLWFVTIHPLEDGNGRITRFITDLALAQGENQSIRFYAISVSLLQHRKSYYEILEQSQRGSSDITLWIDWFISMLDESIQSVIDEVDQTIYKARYWRNKDQSQLNSEQVKILNRMLDGDFPHGINASQYQKVTKVSRATATRHLVFLFENDFLVKSESGGRSTRYLLPSR